MKAKINQTNGRFISKTSILINVSIAKVWEALVNANMIEKYFFGAEVASSWKEGGPITFRGQYQGNTYEEKGVLLQVKPNKLLQYTHWSSLEGLPDVPENYRNWTFTLSEEETHVVLSISEDNIPTEIKRERSDQFWTSVLSTIKQLLEI